MFDWKPKYIKRKWRVLEPQRLLTAQSALYADGQNVSLTDETMKLYATTPLAGTIDEMVEALDNRYGFTPPLAEFILNDPQKKFTTQIQSSPYKGKDALVLPRRRHSLSRDVLSGAHLLHQGAALIVELMIVDQ